jgi:hypothetical protein
MNTATQTPATLTATLASANGATLVQSMGPKKATACFATSEQAEAAIEWLTAAGYSAKRTALADGWRVTFTGLARGREGLHGPSRIDVDTDH